MATPENIVAPAKSGLFWKVWNVDKNELIANLNRNRAGELSAVIQHVPSAAKASGSYRRQLAAFSLAGVAEKRGKVRFPARRIVALGGEAVIEPAVMPSAGSNREMLETALVEERQAPTDSGRRLPEVVELGDEGCAAPLEELAGDGALHAWTWERILRGRPFWPGDSNGGRGPGRQCALVRGV